MSRILILEDEADQAELFGFTLEEAGCGTVTILDDLDDRRVRALDAPDLVILDERIGGRSGTAFIPRLREVFPRARILVLTADADMAEHARRRGADAGRAKPVPMTDLVALVRGLLPGR